MVFIFVAFFVSIFVLLVLVLHKTWELKKGHTFISKGVLPKSDSLIKGQIDLHKELILVGGKKSFKALTSITKESAKHLFLVFAHYLQAKLSKIILKLRGTKGLKHTASVSFFLKRMEEYKDEKKGSTPLPPNEVKGEVGSANIQK